MNKEIERLEYFIPKNEWGIKLKSADEAFCEFSERGIKPDFSTIDNPKRFELLRQAKIWQGRQLSIWEDGIDCVGYYTLLGGEDPREIMPKMIVDFMKKEMFKGADKMIIDNIYQKVLKKWNWFNKLKFYFNDYKRRLVARVLPVMGARQQDNQRKRRTAGI